MHVCSLCRLCLLGGQDGGAEELHVATLGEETGKALATSATPVRLADILRLPLLHGTNLFFVSVAEVLRQVGPLYKTHAAQVTGKRSLTCVNLEMDVEGADLVVGSIADGAHIATLPSVGEPVVVEILVESVGFTAHVTLEGSVSCVHSVVRRQRRLLAECSGTKGTRIGPFVGVDAHVCCERCQPAQGLATDDAVYCSFPSVNHPVGLQRFLSTKGTATDLASKTVPPMVLQMQPVVGVLFKFRITFLALILADFPMVEVARTLSWSL